MIQAWIKHIISVFCLLFSTTTVVSAQSSAAESLLTGYLSSIQGLNASFNQYVYDEDELILEATGTLMLLKPNKLRWHTLEPDETLLIADGQTVINVDPFVEQVTFADQQSLLQDNPFTLLTSDDLTELEAYTISLAQTPFHPQLGSSQLGIDEGIDIVPKDSGGAIEMLSLYFRSGQLVAMRSKDAQGQISIITLSDTDNNPVLSQDAFTYDVPDGYAIDDQRQ